MKHIIVCNAQVPFHQGGAEIHADGLVHALREHGHIVEQVNLPFADYPRAEILKGALAWRLLKLDTIMGSSDRVDAVICLKYPSYVVQHPHKIVWLIHQYRAAYDLLGTAYSDLRDSAEDRRIIRMLRRMDNKTLGEAKALYTNARNTAQRLARYNGLPAAPLYHPPQYAGRYRCDGYGDFIFTVSRQDPLKRVDLLIRAAALTPPHVRVAIAGRGPLLVEHMALARDLGVADRVAFLGFVDEEQLLDLYARCAGVYYAPYDEDYGYVTLEGFMSGKPVLTATDSGGPLEFVTDGESGVVFAPDDLAALARGMQRLVDDRRAAQRMGEAGFERVKGITWDHVVATLTRGIP